MRQNENVNCKKKKSSGPIWNSFLRRLAEGREHFIWLVSGGQGKTCIRSQRWKKPTMRYVAHLPEGYIK